MAEANDLQGAGSDGSEASALWAAAVQALQTFRGLHGHIDVPVDFDVPTTAAWPDAVHGLQLGRLLAFLRTQTMVDPVYKVILDALGFDWKPVCVVQRRRWSWDHQFEALCLYREKHGNLAVPTTYVVPASYPRHLHHLPLGRVVNILRCQSRVHTPERVQQTSDLDALGFRWRLRSKTTFCVVHRPGKRTPMSQLVAWPDQTEALVVFRRLHGHTNVPDGFLVPAMTPWPLPMHRVALDLALASLRAHVYELPSTDAKRLRDAGFFADLPDFGTFVKLLDMYRTEFGTCAVRIDFVVPRMGGLWMNAWRGLALGDLAWSVGLKIRALKAAQRVDLAGVGFVFNVDATGATVLRGLEHFAILNGAIAVPTTFVAPSTWPDDLAGLRLGRYVERMHTAKRLRLLPPATTATLAALTMIPPAHQLAWEPPRDAIERDQALQQLGDVVRDVHTVVPDDFVVPTSGSAWPLGSHGVPLGVRLRWFRQQHNLSVPVCDEIRALPVDTRSVITDGVPLTVDTRSVIADEVLPIAPALTHRSWTLHDRVRALGFYRHLHGTAHVPQKYPDQTAPLWPPEFRGLQVATFAHSIRYHDRRLDKTLEAQLKLVGFSWANSVAMSRCVKRTTRGTLGVGTAPIATQVAALHAYQRLVGDVLAMPNDFAVPPNDANWPPGSSGIVLSFVPPSLAYHWFELVEEDEATVRALGLFTDVPPFEAFVQLISRFTSDGKTTVPLDFVVPSEWSTQWHGAPLGELAWSLGVRLEHLEKRKLWQLAAIGFEFNTSATWAHIVDGLRTYHARRGSTDVPELFIAPRIATWPETMHGMRLGHWVQHLRSARELYLLPPDTIAAVDAIGADAPMPEAVPVLVGVSTPTPAVSEAATRDANGADAPPPEAAALSSGENTAAPAILATAATTTVQATAAAADAPLPVVVPPSPDAVPLPSVTEEQLVVRAAPAPEVDSDANERCDHLVALDLWLHATPRPSESTLLGAISPACPVALRSMSVGALLLELEVGQAFEHLQPALDARQFDRQARWAITFQALAMFKAFHGHLDVPQTFSVDVSVAWPTSMHGLRLGDVVLGLRRLTAAKMTTTIVAQLNAIDFGWAALAVAVAADNALLLAPAPPASIADAAPVASVQDVHATASARGALPSIADDVEGGSDRDDDDRSDTTVRLDSDNDNQSDADNHDIIDLCSTDEDTDDDMGIDHDVNDDDMGIDDDINDDDATDAIPAQDVSVDVRRRPDSLESPAPPVVQAMGRASDDDAPLAADDYPAPPNFLAMKQAVGGDHIVAASSLVPRPAETGCEYPAPPQLPARNRPTPLYPGPPRLPASSTRPFL
ncbi:hypothetical protein SPRG_04001 [Saprolegnia parasitica CBS 223.65]|uniref:Helicase-associated domain-containing protein n=1 Tax=Saprolegnia parasitica (strain CBS 223.65) TaxID=695850 RepID=A0A067CKZ1_SAPPC|nr:hypothetical protein SPRG_04001 [Saprolegnia parasitica CBS 223.65]KDO31384.1 hypothetical protein SPRG_04001 [Saprolegnia parasitica CBS 223.65]|eukprot:XP_012197981.1 hypothetical protein SPRG_04001 [Saprolegnia parasitica CBS 223.65]